MKKLLTSLLAVATMFTLTACGGDSNADKPYAGQELHLITGENTWVKILSLVLKI